MIGALIVTHGIIGKEMVRIALSILKTPMPLSSVSIEHDELPEKTREKIEAALENLHETDGILLMTDLFGGTPSNVALSFRRPGRVEGITGVNLPMILKVQQLDPHLSLKDAAHYIEEYGRRNICHVTEGGSSGHPEKIQN